MAENRRFYYLKLKENFYNSETMVVLESMPDGLLYSNLLLKMYLMSLKNGGILMLNEHLPHTVQTIATFTRHQIGTVERAINPVMAKIHAYVDHWEEAFKKNIGLLLFGDVGTGKSFAAGCIANTLLDQDIPVLMTNFPSILSRLAGTFGEDRTAFLDSLGDYDLLNIDDLGVERNTEYAMEQMFSIVDSRYRSGKPLIVTTNLKLDELKHPPDLAHARIYDRILERCAPILFASPFVMNGEISAHSGIHKIVFDKRADEG